MDQLSSKDMDRLKTSLTVYTVHCTEVRFASFVSGEFTTVAAINPSERKMAKRTSVHCVDFFVLNLVYNQILSGKFKF